MKSLVSFLSKSSNFSNDIIESEEGIEGKKSIPSLKTPFENDKFRSKKDDDNLKNYRLDLSSQFLTIQSPQLNEITSQHQEINLSNNSLHAVPSQIKVCTTIRRLNLEFNQIVQIPLFVSSLPLIDLNLSCNQLKNVPSILYRLPKLRQLNLNYNCIEIIQPELFTMPLVFLGIRSNNFTSLPYTFAKILETLDILDLDWLDHCQMKCQLDEQSRKQLKKLGEKALERKEVITFAQFYFVINDKPLEFSKLDQNQQSILHSLINSESIGLIRYVCQKHPQICSQIDKEGKVPLLYAFNNKKYRSLQILIQLSQYQIDQLNILFILASKKLECQVLRMLINSKIQLNYQCSEEISFGGQGKQVIGIGSTAMHVVMTSFGRNVTQQALATTVVKLLLEMGCDPNIKNQNQLTPVHAAVRLPSLAAIKCASQHNQFNFSKGDLNKNCPLHSASQLGLVSILQIIQTKLVNPFKVNKQNKTAKQIALSSLQIIKLMRKYEQFYIQRVINNQNDEIRNQQKNFNLQYMNNDYALQKPELAPVQAPIQERRVFRLNLSQIKLMDQDKDQSSRGLSSQRKLIQVNEIYNVLQKIIRQQDNIHNIIQELKLIMIEQCQLQQKLIVAIHLCLIVMKYKLGWKYKTTLGSPFIQILNSLKLQSQKLQTNIYFDIRQKYLIKYKDLVEICEESSLHNDQNIILFPLHSLKQQLSQNLKQNISNYWKQTLEEEEQFYNENISEQQWHNAIKGLKIKRDKMRLNSNRFILNDYEQVHTNFLSSTQFYRTQLKIQDHYFEMKVDNSESRGGLSDRIGHYQRKTIFHQKKQINQPLTARIFCNRSEITLKNTCSTSRRASVQVRQHQGEHTQLIKWDSIMSRQSSFLQDCQIDD